MNTLLKVSNLSVAFDGERVLHDLSFDVEEEQTLVILGPNGAGKTVLLKALLGLVPYRGAVIWSRKAKIGYVPQRVFLEKNVPVTVADFLGLKGVTGRETEDILYQVGLKEPSFSEKSIAMISSGQFQRLLVAWALVDNPEVLFFDEPTAGIDIGGQETVYSLIKKVQLERRLTVLLVTHEIDIVYAHATKVLCLNKRVSCYGTPTEILTPGRLRDIFGRDVNYYLHQHE